MFPTRAHRTFSDKQPKNGHHIYQAINEMSCMQTSFTNVNLFSQTGLALRKGH